MERVTFKTPKNLVLWGESKPLERATDGEIITTDEAVIARCKKEGYPVINTETIKEKKETVKEVIKEEKKDGKVSDSKKPSDI